MTVPTLRYQYTVPRLVTKRIRAKVELTEPIRQAMRDWLSNACYLSNNFTFRMKATGRLASWSGAVKAAFADCAAFEGAAAKARKQHLV